MVMDLKIEMTVKELIAFAEKIEKAVLEDIKEKDSKKTAVFRISGKDLLGVLERQNKSKEPKIPNTTPEQRSVKTFG